jgi:hypothetical protein
MLRLVELALFLTPFAAFLIWRLAAVEGGPSIGILVGFGCALLAIAAVLIWLSEDRALPPGASYAPAQIEDGRIVSGHAARP